MATASCHTGVWRGKGVEGRKCEIGSEAQGNSCLAQIVFELVCKVGSYRSARQAHPTLDSVASIYVR